jgi:hypothetical protein
MGRSVGAFLVALVVAVAMVSVLFVGRGAGSSRQAPALAPDSGPPASEQVLSLQLQIGASSTPSVTAGPGDGQPAAEPGRPTAYVPHGPLAFTVR